MHLSHVQIRVYIAPRQNANYRVPPR
jgi:hypothetical protein